MTDEEKFSTHQPVLMAIPKWKKIYSAVEFGCGNYSTLTFLDKKYFPDLKFLLSFESDKTWARKISKRIKDSRHIIITMREKKSIDNFGNIMKEHNLLPDLVFVDGEKPQYRIPSALVSKNYSDLIVAHDVENQIYHSIFGFFKKSFVYKILVPYTAILSDNLPIQEVETYI